MAEEAARAMFGTWKYDAETDEVQSIRRTYDPIRGRSSSHQACNRCHEKKLKCSGEKDGCDRCVASEKRCEYTQSGSRPRKSKKSSTRRSIDSNREESPNRQGSSRHSRGHPRHGESSNQVPATQTFGAADPLYRVDDHFRPEDAFDFSGSTEVNMGYTNAATTAVYPAGVAVSTYQGWPAQGYAVPTTGADATAPYLAGVQNYTNADYGDFEGYQDYDGYQEYGQNLDPRFWPQGR